MKQQQQSEVLTPEEAAEQLRVHPATVYRLLRSGRLPGTRWASSGVFRRADLARFLTSDEPTPEELEESRRVWLDYLAGRDLGRPLNELRREFEARRQ